MHVLSAKASPSASQVSAVEQPLIAVLGNVETRLGALRVPPLLASDLHAMVGATARVRTDLQKVVATWPNSAAAIARTSADISSLNAAAAVLRTDLGT